MFLLASDHSLITVRDDDILYITTKQIKEDILNIVRIIARGTGGGANVSLE